MTGGGPSYRWVLWMLLAGLAGGLTAATVALATGTLWGVAALLPYLTVRPAAVPEQRGNPAC